MQKSLNSNYIFYLSPLQRYCRFCAEVHTHPLFYLESEMIPL